MQRSQSFHLQIPFLALISGILLVPLLPVGIFCGISGAIFQSFFVLHLAVFCCALLVTLRFVSTKLFQKEAPVLSSLSTIYFLFISAVIVCECIKPITARDALIHHLAVPRWWVEGNRI